ncbi:MAG: flagellar basal-body MS-ring/collar protein FliF [Candidatus Melainabacteria bacterium]
MSERFQGILKNFQSRWDMLNFNQKIVVGTLILALLFSTGFFFQQANDDYTVLYSNLSLPDAAAIAAKLKEQRSQFRLADNGTTILVPTKQKNNLVLDTANELTSDQPINLDKIPPVVQGDVQREWIKKMNTQSISLILKSIRGIKNAQVIISQPEHNVFIEEQDPVKASVMLTVEPGFRLHDEQVKVIKNLVAHAVPGLMPVNVAIADNSGNVLEGAGAVGPNGQTDADLRQKSYEDKVSKKVLGILTPVVGKGNAVVSVSAILNFDQAESQIHRVIPAGGSSEAPTGVAVSAQTETEEYAGGVKPEGGAVGMESNIPEPGPVSYPGNDTTGGKKNDKYTRTKSTTNFSNSEESKKVVYAPGTVERLTVAVVLNKVLTAKDTEEIRELVENAAGIDPSRGDSIDIKGFQFSAIPKDKEEELNAAAKLAEEHALYLQIGSIVAVLILGITALIVFYLLFKKPADGELMEEAPEYGFLQETDQLIEDTPIPMIEARLDPEIEHMRESINNMIEEDASEAARVLVTYMKEM